MPRETKAEREARLAKEKLEEKPPAEAPVEEPTPPTVHVLVQYDDAGSVSVEDVVATGDVRPTEISSLLVMARQFWEKKVGLDR